MVHDFSSNPKLLPGELFQLYRNRLGLTQIELAGLLKLKSYQAILFWEEGRVLPKAQNLKQLLGLYLYRGVFMPGNELTEAQQLWAAVKNLNDGRLEASTSYAPFDKDWFQALLANHRSSKPQTQVEKTGAISAETCPPESKGAAGNLPLPLTSLVGRESELTQLTALMEEPTFRLLTLTGVGGTGKTRLALELGWRLLSKFADGVFFVSLAATFEPGLVIPSLARSLGIRENETGQALLDKLKVYLSDKQTLIILDNFEQVIAAGPLVAELLGGTVYLKVLVTSREALQVYGERRVEVSPLTLPKLKQLNELVAQAGRLPETELEKLGQTEAIALFIQQARAVKPDFNLTTENGLAIAEVCYKLGGLPLALELAATRLKLLSPQQMLRRLSGWLGFLVGGGRNLPERQQTLRATIDWSYHLLEPAEQALFQQLAVFSGEFTLEAVEVIACLVAETPQVLNERTGVTAIGLPDWNLIESLVNKSLLRQHEIATPDDTAYEGRFLLLEPLREYALERLQVSGAEGPLRARHAAYYLNLAETAALNLAGAQQETWLARLELEHDNLRAALDWYKSRAEIGLELRLAGALARFWLMRGYLSEGRQRLSGPLDRVRPGSELPPATYQKALYSAGLLAARQGDYAAALALYQQTLALGKDAQVQALTYCAMGEVACRQTEYTAALAYYQESLKLYEQLEDRAGIARALNNLGVLARRQGDYVQARLHYSKSLQLWEQLGDILGTTGPLNNLGYVALAEGDFQATRNYYRQSLELKQALGDKLGVARLLSNLGELAQAEGDKVEAYRLYQQSLALQQALGDKNGQALSLSNLSLVLLAQGDWPQSLKFLQQSLQLHQELEEKDGLAENLAVLAAILKEQGQLEKSARLGGAIDKLVKTIGGVLRSNHAITHQRTQASLQELMGKEEFSRARAEGARLPLDYYSSERYYQVGKRSRAKCEILSLIIAIKPPNQGE